MITRSEFDRVQLRLGRKNGARPQIRHDFTFTGLIRCGECNRMVTAEEKHQVRCDCHYKFACLTTNEPIPNNHRAVRIFHNGVGSGKEPSGRSIGSRD